MRNWVRIVHNKPLNVVRRGREAIPLHDKMPSIKMKPPFTLLLDPVFAPSAWELSRGFRPRLNQYLGNVWWSVTEMPFSAQFPVRYEPNFCTLISVYWFHSRTILLPIQCFLCGGLWAIYFTFWTLTSLILLRFFHLHSEWQWAHYRAPADCNRK